MDWSDVLTVSAPGVFVVSRPFRYGTNMYEKSNIILFWRGINRPRILFGS
jgi:hypothetical protein